MKSKIIALALFAGTAAAVALLPLHRSTGAITPPADPPARIDPVANVRPSIEVVFVLDTTASMGAMIQAAKEKIWSIATSMASARPAPEIKMGLVAFRDRQDAYVTRVIDLSSDLDSIYAQLMDFKAEGGGDGPESVNEALYDAVHNISWSQDANTYKVVFLVGDAPPHMDYPDDVKYPQTLHSAKQAGIVINAIQCGEHGQTTGKWRQIAQLGDGQFFKVEQAGSAVAIATPFDESLARLSKKLDETRLFYGNEAEKAKHARKVESTRKLHRSSTLASRARRAEFNVSESGKANLLGKGDLVDDVASGRVSLEDVDRDQLPLPLQSMPPAAQQAMIEETARRRDDLKRQIAAESKKRSRYLDKKVEERGGAKDSLDHKIYRAVRKQAAGAGLEYSSKAPRY